MPMLMLQCKNMRRSLSRNICPWRKYYWFQNNCYKCRYFAYVFKTTHQWIYYNRLYGLVL